MILTTQKVEMGTIRKASPDRKISRSPDSTVIKLGVVTQLRWKHK
jgi:hypothetical protein